jgi:hypothetical protein
MKEDEIVEMDPIADLALAGLNYAFFGGAMALVGYNMGRRHHHGRGMSGGQDRTRERIGS